MLVADDERDIVELVAIVLGRAGYEVDKADDGEQALRLVRERARRSASSTGGCPAWRDSRSSAGYAARSSSAASPVLILTATVDEERAIRRHGVEPHGFMRKPFEADALLAEVERLLK